MIWDGVDDAGPEEARGARGGRALGAPPRDGAVELGRVHRVPGHHAHRLHEVCHVDARRPDANDGDVVVEPRAAVELLVLDDVVDGHLLLARLHRLKYTVIIISYFWDSDSFFY